MGWCTVVWGGVWWCTVVYGGVRWCTVVDGGVWWCSSLYSGNTSAADAASKPDICSVCQCDGAVVRCPGHHFFCPPCFDHTVRSQVLEGRVHFITIGCKLCCPFCPVTQTLPAFLMCNCASMLKEETFSLFQKCLMEKTVIETQIECEKRFNEKLKSVQQQLQQQTPAEPADPELAEIDKHAAFITERLIIARCPNALCKNQLTDFEACAAMHCDTNEGGCGIYFCAWCLLQVQPSREGTTARTECHNHVRTCPLNPSGNVFPPQPHPQVWMTVMHELARKRVKEYIQSAAVPERLRKYVNDACRKRHPEIQLQDFGQVVSDGYRPSINGRAPRAGGYEENITTLMQMGLATRARAEHALEAMMNNLHDAINLLLATQSR